MLLMRFRALVRGDAVDRDLTDEMHDHLQHLVDENLARGMTHDAARDAGRREFGPVTQLVEASRDARGVMWLANAWQDARYGVRLMSRTPGFAAVAILTIALGIGATTAMFSVVYSVLLQPLPYREPDRLVNLWNTAVKRGLPRAFVGNANVADWKARNHVFEDIAVLRAVANFNLTGQGEPERLFGSRVSANLFSVLGVTPLIGRTFTRDEDQLSGGTHDRVAILTHGLWVRRFGADASIVGRTIHLSGEPFTVVGVMRQDFAYPNREYQIYVPFTFDPQELVNRMNYSYLSVARLKPGVTAQQAQAEMDIISAEIEREHPRENEGIGAEVAPLLNDTVATVRTPLYILLAAVGAMLSIGCANLANLLVSRALARRRELSVRAALGAARGRLIAQSIGELLPMLVAGGVLGLVGAAWAIDGLVPLLPADMPRVENVGLHRPALVFTLGVLAAIAVCVGVWPALEASRSGLSASVSDLSRGNTQTAARSRTRDMLVVAQIAATLWLVIGAALLLRSFVELRKVNPGFNPEGVYSLHLAMPRSKYPTDRDIAAFGNRMVDRVKALPEVAFTALVNRLPLAGGAQTGGIVFEGVDAKAAVLGNVDYRSVTPDYFRALEIPLLGGRMFAESDHASAPFVAIIDERLAKVFNGADPIGRRVRIAVANQPWGTIVGVVGHIRHDRVDRDTRPQIYFPFEQRAQDRMALVVRTRTDPSLVATAVAGAIRSVDGEQPIYDARTLTAVLDRSMAQRWLQTTLLGAFAAMAMILAAIGVYGVIAYAVGQRNREFGIRLAMGATRAEIVGLIMRHGVLLFAFGAVIGLAASAATARVVATLLFNVGPFDAFSVAGATFIFFIVSLLACSLPARRAAAVDPSLALRAE